ncbi:hypothetical protein [Longispora urticae]
MGTVDRMTPFLGGWQGSNKLRLMPTDDYQESAATATVTVTAREFVTLAYTWADGDTPQDGLLLLAGVPDDPAGATAVWVDSYHTGPSWLPLSGTVGEDGVIRLAGTYPAPPGPDWGWEIHIEPDSARVTMHNLVPGHDAYQVVETVYRPA